MVFTQCEICGISLPAGSIRCNFCPDEYVRSRPVRESHYDSYYQSTAPYGRQLPPPPRPRQPSYADPYRQHSLQYPGNLPPLRAPPYHQPTAQERLLPPPSRSYATARDDYYAQAGPYEQYERLYGDNDDGARYEDYPPHQPLYPSGPVRNAYHPPARPPPRVRPRAADFDSRDPRPYTVDPRSQSHATDIRDRRLIPADSRHELMYDRREPVYDRREPIYDRREPVYNHRATAHDPGNRQPYHSSQLNQDAAYTTRDHRPYPGDSREEYFLPRQNPIMPSNQPINSSLCQCPDCMAGRVMKNRARSSERLYKDDNATRYDFQRPNELQYDDDPLGSTYPRRPAFERPINYARPETTLRYPQQGTPAPHIHAPPQRHGKGNVPRDLPNPASHEPSFTPPQAAQGYDHGDMQFPSPLPPPRQPTHRVRSWSDDVETATVVTLPSDADEEEQSWVGGHDGVSYTAPENKRTSAECIPGESTMHQGCAMGDVAGHAESLETKNRAQLRGQSDSLAPSRLQKPCRTPPETSEVEESQPTPKLCHPTPQSPVPSIVSLTVSVHNYVPSESFNADPSPRNPEPAPNVTTLNLENDGPRDCAWRMEQIVQAMSRLNLENDGPRDCAWRVEQIVQAMTRDLHLDQLKAEYMPVRNRFLRFNFAKLHFKVSEKLAETCSPMLAGSILARGVSAWVYHCNRLEDLFVQMYTAMQKLLDEVPGRLAEVMNSTNPLNIGDVEHWLSREVLLPRMTEISRRYHHEPGVDDCICQFFRRVQPFYEIVDRHFPEKLAVFELPRKCQPWFDHGCGSLDDLPQMPRMKMIPTDPETFSEMDLFIKDSGINFDTVSS